MELVHRETVESQGVEAVLLDVGENHVELLAPLSATRRRSASSWPSAGRACTTWPTRSPTSTRRSPSLRDAGVRMIDEQPRTGIRTSRVAFLHPSASGGVLTELVEPAEVHA